MAKKPREKDYKDSKLQKLMSDLAGNLRAARKGKDLSQLELAHKTKSSISTISAIEMKAANDIRLSTISSFAAALDIKDPLQLLKPTLAKVNPTKP